MESIEKIKALLAMMQDNDIVELELEEGEFSIALRKQGAFTPPMQQAQMAMPVAPQPVAQAQPAGQPAAAQAVDDSLVQIKSPIVGTFYRAPAPEQAPFVEEGAAVRKDSVICIIEAMKIMNEIKAEMEGVIEKVLVESVDPVEYCQPLFLLRRK
ncbi:MAG: acetyl-CoA carboxylase biotin carboxyl carrier protein [Planctomycetes bacterium]|nr:acetyl-CoA carboxylase biotin carboxyl carrier protein [Planctomycetota bacterium]